MTVNEPKELVATIPLNWKVGLDVIVTDPVVEVALTPVIPITSAGDNEPTLTVQCRGQMMPQEVRVSLDICGWKYWLSYLLQEAAPHSLPQPWLECSYG